MSTFYKTGRMEKRSVSFLWLLGASLLFIAQAPIAPAAEEVPELVPLIEHNYGGILLALRAASGDEPRARLLIEGDDPQTYASVAQWRDPQSGAVLKVVPLAARPSISDLSASPVTTALAPQGDILANVGPENVLFWQSPWTGTILQRFPHQNYPLAFSPDGQKFVSQHYGSEEKPGFSLVVRSVPQGQVLYQLELPRRADQVFWSSDARHLCAIAFAEQKPDIRVWDTASGQLQWQAKGEAANFLRTWFLRDGRLAVLDSVNSGRATLRVRLWPAKGGQPTVITHDHRSTHPDVRCAVLNDGRLLVSVVERTAPKQLNGAMTQKRVTWVWDVPQMARPRLVKADEAALSSKATWRGQYYAPPRPFSSKSPTPVDLKRVSRIAGRMVVAGDSRFWEAATGQLKGSFLPVPPRASALAIAPDGKFFASAGGGGGGGSGGAFLGVWESATKKLLWHKAVSLSRSNGGEYSEAGSMWTTALAFSSDGRRLLVASALDQAPLALYETRSGKLLWSTERSGSAGIGFDVSGAALSGDGERVAALSSKPQNRFKTQVQIVNGANGQPLESWDVPAPVYALSWSHDRSLLALSTASGHVAQGSGYSSFNVDEALVELREARTGSLQSTLHGASGPVQALRLSPDGKLLAGAGDNGDIYLWSVTNGQLVHTMQAHLAAARDVAWNGNSQVVSVGEDGTVRFWNASQGQLLATALFLQTRTPSENVYRNMSKKRFGGGQFERLPPVEWLFYTPDGFYDASPGAEKYFRWRVGSQLWPAAKFKSRFYQPSRVRKALSSKRS